MELPESPESRSSLDTTGIVEALIFSANEPVEAAKVAQVVAEVTGEDTLSEKDVYRIVAEINEQYTVSGRPFQVFEWAGGFRIATQPEYGPFVKALHEIDTKRKLSRSLIETLAIVAYKQPVTKPEIDFVRGVDSDYALRRLMELDLVDVIGRSDTVGKPLLYGSTAEFLDKFGLKSVDELPSIKEIEDLLDDPAFNRERAELLMSKGLSFGTMEKVEDDAAGDVPAVTDAGESRVEDDAAEGSELVAGTEGAEGGAERRDEISVEKSGGNGETFSTSEPELVRNGSTGATGTTPNGSTTERD